MCRAVKILCVAEDDARLAELRAASVGAEWELCAGATDAEEARRQLESEHPQQIVVFGAFDDLIALVAERAPWVRIVSDRDAPGAVVATSLEDVRGLLAGMPRPGGPIGG
jgi:hypothetical protein